MTTLQVKPDYSALPTRVLREEGFTALDLRVLGAIAWHDRFNKNGLGCFASNATIGARSGCHANSAGRAIGRLLERGVLRDLNQTSGKRRSRRRMLVIVYTESQTKVREVNPPVEIEAPKAGGELNPPVELERADARPRELNRKRSKPLNARPDPAIKSPVVAATNSTASVDIREEAEAYEASGSSLPAGHRRVAWGRPTEASRERVAQLVADNRKALLSAESEAAHQQRAALAALGMAANERLLARHGVPDKLKSLLIANHV